MDLELESEFDFSLRHSESLNMLNQSEDSHLNLKSDYQSLKFLSNLQYQGPAQPQADLSENPLESKESKDSKYKTQELGFKHAQTASQNIEKEEASPQARKSKFK